MYLLVDAHICRYQNSPQNLQIWAGAVFSYTTIHHLNLWNEISNQAGPGVKFWLKVLFTAASYLFRFLLTEWAAQPDHLWCGKVKLTHCVWSFHYPLSAWKMRKNAGKSCLLLNFNAYIRLMDIWVALLSARILLHKWPRYVWERGFRCLRAPDASSIRSSL